MYIGSFWYMAASDIGHRKPVIIPFLMKQSASECCQCFTVVDLVLEK